MKTETTIQTLMTKEKFLNTHRVKRFLKSLNKSKRANQRGDIFVRLLNDYWLPISMVDIVVNDWNVIPQYWARILELRKDFWFTIISSCWKSFINKKGQLITPTYFTLIG